MVSLRYFEAEEEAFVVVGESLISAIVNSNIMTTKQRSSGPSTAPCKPSQ